MLIRIDDKDNDKEQSSQNKAFSFSVSTRETPTGVLPHAPSQATKKTGFTLQTLKQTNKETEGTHSIRERKP